jgi:hypothetical protein
VSFLDNLENNLKAMESREEIDPEALKRQQSQRAAERSEALRRAPFEQALKASPFAGELIAACRRLGHARRAMVRPTWLDSMLRLETRLDGVEQRLELHPTGEGVKAVFLREGVEVSSEVVDLNSSPAPLAERYIR